jgi:hypothetical protein
MEGDNNLGLLPLIEKTQNLDPVDQEIGNEHATQTKFVSKSTSELRDLFHIKQISTANQR